MSKQRKKVIFIAWTKFHKRTYTLSHEVLNAEPFFLGFRIGRSRLWRSFEYLVKTTQTFSILLKEKPNLIFAQSGPSYCPLSVAIYSMIFKTLYVIDAHTSAITGFWIKLPSYKWAMRKASIILVHNQLLQSLANSKKIKTLILEDYLPNLQNPKLIALPKHSGNFAVIPSSGMNLKSRAIRETIHAASILQGQKVDFFFTGNIGSLQKPVPKNLHFTGYLPENEFMALLFSVAGVIILLDRLDKDFVQPRRAIEALSLEKPMILTDSQISKELFPKGVIFVKNTRNEIASACLRIIKEKNKFNREIKESKIEFSKRWQEHFSLVANKLDALLNGL